MRLTSSLIVPPPIRHVLHGIKPSLPEAPLDQDVGASIGSGRRPLQRPRHVHLCHEEQSMMLSWRGGGVAVRQWFLGGATAWIGNHNFQITAGTSGWWGRGSASLSDDSLVARWNFVEVEAWQEWSHHRSSVEVEAQQGSRWLRRCRRSRGGTTTLVGLETPTRVGWWGLNRVDSVAIGLAQYSAVWLGRLGPC
jgi:hypothetical protein